MPRHALLIGTTAYQDPLVSQLTAPASDVEELHALLTAPEVGGFEAQRPLLNSPAHQLKLELESFFQDRALDDLLLLYFSGHGMLDDHGKLYLLASNTDRRLLRATAIDAAFVRELMDQCRAQKQVLILDCCHSGAFGRSAKASIGTSASTDAFFGGNGRVVLTASNSTQFAFEGNKVIGDAKTSLFTHFLLQGLRTGDADLNGNGQISVDELYLYAHGQVAKHTSAQTPGKFADRQEGELIIARNARPRARPELLPEDIVRSIESSVPAIRKGALEALGELLRAPHPGVALAARQKLSELTSHDSRSISEAATRLLAAENGSALAAPAAAARPPVPEHKQDAELEPAEDDLAEATEPEASTPATAADDEATRAEALIDSNSAVVQEDTPRSPSATTAPVQRAGLLITLAALGFAAIAAFLGNRDTELPAPAEPDAPAERVAGPTPEPPAPSPDAPVPGVVQLAMAKAEFAQGSSISAHMTLLDMPPDSPLWGAPEVAQIQADWADEYFARVAKSSDQRMRRGFLKEIAEAKGLDAGRRTRATDELARLDAKLLRPSPPAEWQFKPKEVIGRRSATPKPPGDL